MNGLKISLAGAVLLLATPGAMGASIESRESAAKKACLVGDVDKGADILADLYVETNDSGYIYNQARCFEQNGKNVQSVLRFKEYLRKAKNLTQADTDAVLKKIDELQGVDGKHAAQPAPAPLQPSAAQPSSAPAASAVPPSAAVATTAGVQASLPQTSPSRGLRMAGVGTFALGVAGVAAGLGFALAANHLADDLEAKPARYQPSKESTQASYATASKVSYVAGAACLAGGALLYYLGWRTGREFSATLEPMVSAQTAGARVQVAF